VVKVENFFSGAPRILKVIDDDLRKSRTSNYLAMSLLDQPDALCGWILNLELERLHVWTRKIIRVLIRDLLSFRFESSNPTGDRDKASATMLFLPGMYRMSGPYSSIGRRTNVNTIGRDFAWTNFYGRASNDHNVKENCTNSFQNLND
jgi:hypothetical protein